jgi:hypothetical protein
MDTSTNTREGITELSVDEVFVDDASKYVIPIYQRNYSWDEVEISQLLEDIKSAAERKDDYYLGNLIVSKKDDRYDVIDGQQRLTTLYILCKCLSIPVHEKSLTFQIRDVYNDTLKNLLDLSKTIGTPDEKTYSEEIFRGYNIIKNHLSEKIKNHLNHVKLLRIEVPVGTDLNHYFEIMNTRGEQLEAQDIIKARMMDALGTEDKRIFSIIWNACSDMDCYVQMKFNTDTRKLIFGETWNEFIHKDYEALANIIKIDTAESSLTTLEDINDTTESYLTTLEDILNDKSKYGKKTEPKSNYELIDGNFESIIKFPYFLIHINILVNDPNATLDDKKLLDMYNLEYCRNPENVRSFIFHLLKHRFLFDNFIIKRDYEKEKTDGDWSLKKCQQNKNSYYKGTFGDEKDGDTYINREIRTLQSALRITYTSPKSMAWVTDLMGWIIDFLKDDSSLSDINGKFFLDKIEDYCRGKVNDALKKFAETEEKNAYRDMERIVYTYLDYILWRDGYDGIEIPIGWKFMFRNSLEHFYPQTSDKNEGHEPLEDNLLHNFGNLCLVDVSTNAKFSNLEPAAKIEHCENTIKQSLKLMIMAEKTKFNKKWVETIEEHGNEMLKLLYRDIGEAFQN